MHTCYALLDDASDDAGASSRLYTAYLATLTCGDAAAWPALLATLQQELEQGRHAVLLGAYELGQHLQGLPAPDPKAPLARILLFERCEHLNPAQVADWLDQQAGSGPAGISRARPDVDQPAFAAALARIHAYIEAGDTYQVNYTYRLHFDAYGAPAALYARLRARQPVPYGALIALPDGGAVLSLSPELFMRHSGGTLTARPMKGTAPAAPHGAGDDDVSRAAALAADPKNRAENLMIVDLLRNDMGRIAATGTVHVPHLFDVKRYGGVLQMTSTVQARLRAGSTLGAIFDALYPCGSITGAPKRRSMEIIAELEASPRGLYTGAIGWFGPAPAQSIGDFCLSVPIRTLVLAPPRGGVAAAVLGVGAGIVHDSDAAAEYAECQLKARFLTGLEHQFELFETMHASRNGGVRQRARHLRRLAASAAYFGFRCDVAALTAALDAACAGLAGDGPHRLRLALDQHGTTGISHAALTPLQEPVGVLLATRPTDADDLFLRHKTSQRAVYDAGWRAAEALGAFDTLFVNQRGELTEGGRSNIFIQLDGRWYTPPLASGALPGVMRGVLLDDPAWNASERVLTPAMLRGADAIVVCNALRGPLRAVLITPELPAV